LDLTNRNTTRRNVHLIFDALLKRCPFH